MPCWTSHAPAAGASQQTARHTRADLDAMIALRRDDDAPRADTLLGL
jgi:hypothetical protein